jgi:heme/copper-type cytochrome/quinol oxidase subunit 2
MKATRFPIDVRLWEWIALAVLAASWYIPVISIKSGPYFSIATALKELVAAVHQHDDSATQLFRGVFIVFASASVVVAIVFGWLLHCLVVIVRARRRERTKHTA